MTLKGIVVEGKKRGRDLGYPTANISIPSSTPSGIYVSSTKIKGKTYSSATFIGNVTSFNEKDFVCETYILDFSKNIYNTEITVTLLQKIRGNEKFESIEKLVSQIKEDVEKVRIYFRANHV